MNMKRLSQSPPLGCQGPPRQLPRRPPAVERRRPATVSLGEPGLDAALPEGGPETQMVRELPAATYAVFECRFRDIGPTYGFIWREWLKTSTYEQDTSKLGFDHYPPKTTDGESPVQIWFPVKGKESVA